MEALPFVFIVMFNSIDMKIAVFPGSFDPFTNAHLDIVERGLMLFDEIVIAIGVNSSKVGLLSVEQRSEAIKNTFENNSRVAVKIFDGLTVDFCKEIGASYILRGLRNAQDLDFESVIAQNNFLLNPNIETFFLLSRNTTNHISSTIVRDIWRNQGNITHLVPDPILHSLEKIR